MKWFFIIVHEEDEFEAKIIKKNSYVSTKSRSAASSSRRYSRSRGVRGRGAAAPAAGPPSAGHADGNAAAAAINTATKQRIRDDDVILLCLWGT